MVGVGETYLAAFAVAAGLGELAAGLITTVPVLGGSLIQTASPWGVGCVRSYRRWVVASAAVQAASLAVLVIMALQQQLTTALLFGVATLYWAGGLAANPAWNAWVEHLVPRPIRPTFFAKRSRVCQACVFAGIVTGGILLRVNGATHQSTQTFACLFGIAACCRFASVLLLACQTETRHWMHGEPRPRSNIGESWRAIRTWDQQTKSLVVYLMAMQTAVYVASPYFTPYMLHRMKLSYLQYMLLISLGFAGKALANPWAARAARRLGADRLLWIGGLGIIPLSGLWLVSNSLLYLSVLQLAGGALWACYELSMLLLFFERIPKHQRVEVLSIYNVGNSAAMLIGSLLGGAILLAQPAAGPLFLTVFLSSSLLRLATLWLLPRSNQQTHLLVEVACRMTAARRSLGRVARPLVATVDGPVSELPISREASAGPP
jgi:MFS family permease